MTLTSIEHFVRKRYDALFSPDRKKVEAFLVKYGGKELANKATIGIPKTGLLFPTKQQRYN